MSHIPPQTEIKRSKIGRSWWPTYRSTPDAKSMVFAQKQTDYQHMTSTLTDLNYNDKEYVRSQIFNRFTLFAPLVAKRSMYVHFGA